jgi:hypothetical protein
MRKSLKVAERQRRLKNLEKGGRGVKRVEEIQRRRMSTFGPLLKSRKVVRSGGK